MQSLYYSEILKAVATSDRLLAILIDPEKFNLNTIPEFLNKLPKETTHFFVGGSTDENKEIDVVVAALKQNTTLPVFLFPGSHHQVTEKADGLLFLSLHSGRNPEYLIGQQVKAASLLKNTSLEVISTSYILIDGGHIAAVARVSETDAMPQSGVKAIVNTALAGQLMGSQLIYLEAGSGAKKPVAARIIAEVKAVVSIPIIVGGGIRTKEQLEQAYLAGADLVVMGTVFENA